MGRDPYVVFTSGSQQVLALSIRAAKNRNDPIVHTTHLLIGMMWLGQGVAVNALKNMGHNPESIRHLVESMMDPISVRKGPERPPYTQKLKNVLARAMKDSEAFGHPNVSTGHLLLALIRDREGIPGAVFTKFGIGLERCQGEILRAHSTPIQTGVDSPHFQLPKAAASSQNGSETPPTKESVGNTTERNDLSVTAKLWRKLSHLLRFVRFQ